MNLWEEISGKRKNSGRRYFHGVVNFIINMIEKVVTKSEIACSLES